VAKPVLLSQAQGRGIGRLQLIQLVGLEIEKLSRVPRVVEEIRVPALLARRAARARHHRTPDVDKEKYGDDRGPRSSGPRRHEP
jgi:hypothetical protein